MSPDSSIGAFIGTESYDFDYESAAKFGFLGLEAAYTKNDFSLQAAIGMNKNFNYTEYNASTLAIDAVYRMGAKMSLTGGLHVATAQYDGWTDPFTYQYAYIGTGYAITPKMTVNLDYSKVNAVGRYTQQALSLSVTYEFMRPAIFHQRASNSLIPGW